MREVHRVLFIRTDRMGDLLMNLPAIRLVRQTFPKAWLTLLTDEPVADLLKGHPDIDEVMPIPAERLARDGWRGAWELSRRLRRASFDVAIVSNPDKLWHLAVFLAFIPHRVGYDRKWGFLLTKRIPDNSATSARHQMDLNLELASLASDRVWDGTLALPAEPDAQKRFSEKWAADVAADGAPVIALHPGTSNPAKRWPIERFQRLAEELSRKGARVLLIGGAEEAGNSGAVAARCGGSAVDWTGKLPLRQLVALFASGRVRALVSCDSGPVHVAWVAGTPVVALYAQGVPGSDPRRWGPRDGRSAVLFKPMEQIGVEEVLAAVQRVAGL